MKIKRTHLCLLALTSMFMLLMVGCGEPVEEIEPLSRSEGEHCEEHIDCEGSLLCYDHTCTDSSGSSNNSSSGQDIERSSRDRGEYCEEDVHCKGVFNSCDDNVCCDDYNICTPGERIDRFSRGRGEYCEVDEHCELEFTCVNNACSDYCDGDVCASDEICVLGSDGANCHQTCDWQTCDSGCCNGVTNSGIHICVSSC